MDRRLRHKRTKIVCTIGPATASSSRIGQLIKAGMNVARFNLSHGSHKEHEDYIQTVRRLSQQLGIQVSILMDLPGPKYRTGKLKGGQAVLKKGAELMLTIRPVAGDATLVPVDLPNLTKEVKKGDTVFLDDGAMQLRVLGTDETGVKCRVEVGGVLTERRGLVVPGMHTIGPYVSDTLRSSLAFAIEQKPDYIALSFISTADDVNQVKAVLAEKEAHIPIIAKIERAQAVDSFDAILSVSDGIMVARGDLGVDMPLEKVPLVQKAAIRKCNQVGKPVITATQMLESMVKAARPTRAEITDVANAIFDGTDATMLSAETSIGQYPIQALKMMATIARETEKQLNYEQLLRQRSTWARPETDELIALSACQIAQSLGAAAIVALTASGSTAARVARYRPHAPILAITPNAAVAGQLLLHWGVHPVHIGEIPSLDGLFTTGARLARESGLARQGDLIVITGGIPLGLKGGTNLLKIEMVS